MIDPEKSLHQLGDTLRQLANLAAHCQQIEQNLPTLIENTKKAVKIRNIPNAGQDVYTLDRQDVGDVHSGSQLEIRLERSLWNCYRSAEEQLEFLPPLCSSLVSYQVPLFNQAQQQGWGKIDLLGRSWFGHPVVIELKKADGDNLLSALIQGAAYCISVRESWNAGPLRTNWQQHVMENVPEHLQTVPLVILAPTNYWTRAVGSIENRLEGQLFPDHWQNFHSLVTALRGKGILTSFAAFDYTDLGERLCCVNNVRAVTLPM